MASITFSIQTDATGVVSKAYDLVEADAQRIFAMLIGTAGTVTDENGNVGPKRLGACLIDETASIVHSLTDRTLSYEQSLAAAAASAAVAPIAVEDGTVVPIAPAP
jgi:hypothetical protein